MLVFDQVFLAQLRQKKEYREQFKNFFIVVQLRDRPPDFDNSSVTFSESWRDSNSIQAISFLSAFWEFEEEFLLFFKHSLKGISRTPHCTWLTGVQFDRDWIYFLVLYLEFRYLKVFIVFRLKAIYDEWIECTSLHMLLTIFIYCLPVDTFTFVQTIHVFHFRTITCGWQNLFLTKNLSHFNCFGNLFLLLGDCPSPWGGSLQFEKTLLLVHFHGKTKCCVIHPKKCGMMTACCSWFNFFVIRLWNVDRVQCSHCHVLSSFDTPKVLYGWFFFLY